MYNCDYPIWPRTAHTGQNSANSGFFRPSTRIRGHAKTNVVRETMGFTWETRGRGQTSQLDICAQSDCRSNSRSPCARVHSRTVQRGYRTTRILVRGLRRQSENNKMRVTIARDNGRAYSLMYCLSASVVADPTSLPPSSYHFTA